MKMIYHVFFIMLFSGCNVTLSDCFPPGEAYSENLKIEKLNSIGIKVAFPDNYILEKRKDEAFNEVFSLFDKNSSYNEESFLFFNLYLLPISDEVNFDIISELSQFDNHEILFSANCNFKERKSYLLQTREKITDTHIVFNQFLYVRYDDYYYLNIFASGTEDKKQDLFYIITQVEFLEDINRSNK